MTIAYSIVKVLSDNFTAFSATAFFDTPNTTTTENPYTTNGLNLPPGRSFAFHGPPQLTIELAQRELYYKTAEYFDESDIIPQNLKMKGEFFVPRQINNTVYRVIQIPDYSSIPRMINY